MITLSNKAQTREQIADELGVYRSTSLHWLLTTITNLLDVYIPPRESLDDYVIWILKKLTTPPFAGNGRVSGKKRLNRKKIKKKLLAHPEEFGASQYSKAIEGNREQQIIKFTYLKKK